MTSDVNNLYGMVIVYRCIRSQSPYLNMGGNWESHVLSNRAMWPYVTSVFLIQQEQTGSQLLESLGPVWSQSLDGHMKYTALHNHPVFSWIDLVRTRAGHGIGGLLQFGWFTTIGGSVVITSQPENRVKRVDWGKFTGRRRRFWRLLR